jgi:hypothetical protein
MRIVKLLLHMETVEEWEFSDSKQNERTFVDKRGRIDDEGEIYIYLGDAIYERK